VRHEAGHTLGFEHEHMRTALVKRIDRKKAFAYYAEECGWSEKDTIEQVLTPVSERTLFGTTEVDPTSIMCYQIPKEVTKDGKAIPGGRNINAKDFEFAAKLYPKPRRSEGQEAPAPQPLPAATPIPTGPLLTPSAVADRDTFHIVIMDDPDPDAQAKGAAPVRPHYGRIFASYAGARVTEPMRLNKAEGETPTRFGSIIGVHKKIKNYTNREKGSLPDDEGMMEFGKDLFDTLFQGDVKRLYDEARSRQHGRRLDLVLTSMISWIAELPWEFAYDFSRRSFLATEDIHFVRNVLTSIPADFLTPRQGPLRILVVAAQPVGFGLLSIAQEAEVIRRGFQALIDAKLAEVEVLPRATPGGIHARVATGNFNVVHFIGHGGFDDKTGGYLVFEDDKGGQYPVNARSAHEIFCQRNVSLVFLNSCQSGTGGLADFNKGVAQAIVAHGLPALVANQYSVLDASATSFAQNFYWALAQGMTLGAAAREARIAVNYSLQGEIVDWAVPVVYARDPNMTLGSRSSDKLALPDAASQTRTRRGGERRKVQVAVWDMDNVFPALGTTLAALNDVQPAFGFALADLSAPIDAWYQQKKAPNGAPYLWAEKLAKRLERAPLDLQVDVLACVTRHWMYGDGLWNLYGWWPDAQKPPVIVFSAAGFDELMPEGPQTDRAIANLLVMGLSGFLADLDTHPRGARDCPLFRNTKRDLAYITEPRKFDAACRARIAKEHADELKSLDALLKWARSR